MKKNIGTTDRLIRFGIGVLLLLLAWWFSSWILLAAALFTFYEAAASWCVMYQLLGKSSCELKKKN